MADFIDDYDEELQDNYFPKKKRETIEVPDFLQSTGELPTEEQMISAVLNNVPGNQQTEEQNHLKQLEEVAKNYSIEEWNRVLLHAPSSMMADELKRRLNTYEDYMRNTRSNLSILTEQKL